MIQSWKENGVRGPQLKAVLEFKYIGVLFQIEGRMEQEIESQISAMAAVMWLCWSIIVKELSEKAKISIYRSVNVSLLTYGQEIWVMTKRTRTTLKDVSSTGWQDIPLE